MNVKNFWKYVAAIKVVVDVDILTVKIIYSTVALTTL